MGKIIWILIYKLSYKLIEQLTYFVYRLKGHLCIDLISFWIGLIQNMKEHQYIFNPRKLHRT